LPEGQQSDATPVSVRPSYLALKALAKKMSPPVRAKGCKCNYHPFTVEVLIYINQKVAGATIVAVALPI
jgi:hypothetical protein